MCELRKENVTCSSEGEAGLSWRLSVLEYWKHTDNSDLHMRERERERGSQAQWRCSRLARRGASLHVGQEEGMLWNRTVTTSGGSSLKLYVLTGKVLICYFHMAFVSSLGLLLSFMAEAQRAGVSAVLSLSRAVRVWLQQGGGQPEPASPASHSSHLCVCAVSHSSSIATWAVAWAKQLGVVWGQQTGVPLLLICVAKFPTWANVTTSSFAALVFVYSSVFELNAWAMLGLLVLAWHLQELHINKPMLVVPKCWWNSSQVCACLLMYRWSSCTCYGPHEVMCAKTWAALEFTVYIMHRNSICSMKQPLRAVLSRHFVPTCVSLKIEVQGCELSTRHFPVSVRWDCR